MVTAALTKYLHAHGHDVRLFMPLYAAIDRERFGLRPVARLTDLAIGIGAHRYQYSVYSATLPGLPGTGLPDRLPAPVCPRGDLFHSAG